MKMLLKFLLEIVDKHAKYCRNYRNVHAEICCKGGGEFEGAVCDGP